MAHRHQLHPRRRRRHGHPLSTGLIVDYFTGDRRVRQLGYSSAINNLTLVVATAVTGYLADVNWHLPFLVYTLPGISLALSFFLRRSRPRPSRSRAYRCVTSGSTGGKLVGLMLFYFFATYAVLAIAFYASFLVDDYKIRSSFSGVLISLFFLAIMLPGLFIDRIIRALKQNVNLVSLGADLRGAAVRGHLPRQDDARRRGAAHGLRLRGDPARHLRQGGDHRPAPVPQRSRCRSSWR